jgi:hypothetical protein
MVTAKKTTPVPPPNRPHKAIDDLQSHFAALTAKTPVDHTFRAAFVRSKITLAHTHAAVDAQSRDFAVKSVIDRLGGDAQKAFGQLEASSVEQPVPGGVGYGFFYMPTFKTGWGRGTSIAFDIVCPTPPGGNVNTFLYLTATNRSGLGVEAFISYNGQGDTHFRVFDWSRSDHWQTDIQLSGLANYLQTVSAHGYPYQVLPVWNSTWLLQGTTWRNQVLLYNHVRGGWDLVYQYDYSATDTQQKTDWVGSWAPIVETFQPLYSHTNQFGAIATQLISADNNGHWGSWALLSPADSTIRTDNVGFHLVFLDPNYSWTVTS